MPMGEGVRQTVEVGEKKPTQLWINFEILHFRGRQGWFHFITSMRTSPYVDEEVVRIVVTT